MGWPQDEAQHPLLALKGTVTRSPLSRAPLFLNLCSGQKTRAQDRMCPSRLFASDSSQDLVSVPGIPTLHTRTHARTQTHTLTETPSWLLYTVFCLTVYTLWHRHAKLHMTHTEVHTNRSPVSPLHTLAHVGPHVRIHRTSTHHTQGHTSILLHVPVHSHGPVHTGEHTPLPPNFCHLWAHKASAP